MCVRACVSLFSNHVVSYPGCVTLSSFHSVTLSPNSSHLSMKVKSKFLHCYSKSSQRLGNLESLRHKIEKVGNVTVLGEINIAPKIFFFFISRVELNNYITRYKREKQGFLP